MENQKKVCKKLIKRWKELEEEFPKIKKIPFGEEPKKNYLNLSIEEIDEHRKMMENIRDNCTEFLSPSDRYKIHERTKRS